MTRRFHLKPDPTFGYGEFGEHATVVYDDTERDAADIAGAYMTPAALLALANKAEQNGAVAELNRLLIWGTANIPHPLREHIYKRLRELRGEKNAP